MSSSPKRNIVIPPADVATRLDAQAAESWRQGAEDTAEVNREFASVLRELSPLERVALADLFKRLITVCLPAGTRRGQAVRWKAGYNRMVAIAFRVAPEMLLHATEEDIAEQLGITARAFRKHLDHVDRMLAVRAAMGPAGKGGRRGTPAAGDATAKRLQ